MRKMAQRDENVRRGVKREESKERTEEKEEDMLKNVERKEGRDCTCLEVMVLWFVTADGHPPRRVL